jgi:hypothetical protein
MSNDDLKKRARAQFWTGHVLPAFTGAAVGGAVGGTYLGRQTGRAIHAAMANEPPIGQILRPFAAKAGRIVYGLAGGAGGAAVGLAAGAAAGAGIMAYRRRRQARFSVGA